MSKANVSKRYAEALFQLAKEKNLLDSLEPELLIVKEVFQNNKEFNNFLEHPQVEGTKKKQLINQVFDGFSPIVTNTLKLLVDRHSEQAVPAIVDYFVAFTHKEKGVAEAKVYSIRELSDTEKEQLSSVFAKRLNLKSLNIVNIVDPSILGGVKLQVGNTIYDGTIKGKLQRIERNIVSAN